MNGELLRLVDAIHRDKGIDKEVLFDSLEQAVLTAARRKYGTVENLRVRIDRNTGEVRAYEGEEKILPIDLGRIAGQTAKQVIIQRIREAEAEVVFDEFERYRHQLMNGQVQRVESGTIVVNLGKTEGYLPRHEQVRGENYRVGDRIRAYVVEVKKTPQKVKIILSRSHPDLIARLFELEVPEVAEGLIQIRKLVREAGYKTKVAVESMDAKVDAIGACVGVRGTRIRNIIDEIGGEKIDIIRWNDSLEVLLMNALKPAQVNSITLFPDEKRALVLVDEDQLSLAIGRKGQNVRLASKLVGWDIDIMTEEEAVEQGLVIDDSDFSQVEYIEDPRGDVTAIGSTIRTGPVRSPRRRDVEDESSPAAPAPAPEPGEAGATGDTPEPEAAPAPDSGAGTTEEAPAAPAEGVGEETDSAGGASASGSEPKEGADRGEEPEKAAAPGPDEPSDGPVPPDEDAAEPAPEREETPPEAEENAGENPEPAADTSAAEDGEEGEVR